MVENGKGKARASMILGIISVALLVGGYSSGISVILGIIGLILAGGSKKEGYTGGMRTAGFILSLISVIFGVVVFVSCIACFGLAMLESGYSNYYYY